MAITKPEGSAPAAKGFCSPETGLSAAAILVLFECLEHPEWQVQKEAIRHLKKRATRDVLRETLIKHAVGLPDASDTLVAACFFPAKSFSKRDREIVKALELLVREKDQSLGGQVQSYCLPALALKAAEALWCQAELQNKSPEVYLAIAIILPTLKRKHIQGCCAAPKERDRGARNESARSLGIFAKNQIKNVLAAFQIAANEASQDITKLSDGLRLRQHQFFWVIEDCIE